MEGIQLKPRKAQIMVMTIGLGILCGLSLAAPVTGLAAAILVPLFACPLVGRKEEWLAWLTAAAPTVGAMLEGFSAIYAGCLLLPGMLPLLATRLLKPKQRTGPRGILLYTGITAAALTLCAACITWLLGGPIGQTLPICVTEFIARMKNPGLVLYRLAASGLLTLPENYGHSDLLSHLLEPALVQQMLMSLRLTLEKMLGYYLPYGFVQISLLAGLFTALRTEHAHGVMLVIEANAAKPSERRARVLPPPGFRHLTLPNGLRRAVYIMWALALILISGTNSLAATVGMLFFSLCSALLQLNGAAVGVYMFGNRHPDHIVLIGIIIGIIYAVSPMALMIIGVSDTILHYRTKKSDKTD
ncbi:MAG: hypothetical protein IKJ26_06725 [Clostridia bacterium]|nr:hypothetical protein [Clostridia bacterium]